jgi:hypothetical protein
MHTVRPISDRALQRLRQSAALPDFEGTRYRLMQELGRGGMGVVYLAEDALLERKVAIKVFHLDDVSEELAERMRHEARTLARLQHPNIVPVHDFGQLAGGRLYYSMKYVEGSRIDAQLGESLPRKLRLFDGSTAMLYPDSRPLIVGILIGSTFKGLITGLVAGFFARKFQSIPLGILVGLVAGMAVTYPIAIEPVNGNSYFLEIMIPGSILGAVVGFATQRFGKPA